MSESDPMSRQDLMSADAAELFRWRAETGSTWLEAAQQARLLLAEIDGGHLEASAAELAALRTFVATVEGMSATG